jgi:hypothetical protein
MCGFEDLLWVIEPENLHRGWSGRGSEEVVPTEDGKYRVKFIYLGSVLIIVDLVSQLMTGDSSHHFCVS